MPKGGLRVDKQGTTNHLFKPKWRNKKTTAIRIPEIFKPTIMALVRSLDRWIVSEHKELVAVAIMRINSAHDEKIDIQIKSTENSEEYADKIYQDIFNKDNQNKQNNSQNKYQIAVECFGEFVENQKLNMEDLSKSRKGTKKHQLHEINQWLIEQSNNSN